MNPWISEQWNYCLTAEQTNNKQQINKLIINRVVDKFTFDKIIY